MIKDFLLKNEVERYKNLELPDFPRNEKGYIDREAMLKTLLCEEYGIVNIDGLRVGYSLVSVEEKVVAGKAKVAKILVKLTKNELSSSFPFYIYIPYARQKNRTVIHIGFDESPFNKYCPLEELTDMGLTVVYVPYEKITSDDGNFQNGIAPLLTDRKAKNSAGKLAIWAYAVTLVADFLLKEEIADKKHLAVAGQSRLGKVALLVGAFDERFTHIHSNCSGCCGLAISREKTGETVKDILKQFPYWFSENFEKYSDNVDNMPFDQHFLLSAIAPRKATLVIAEDDEWADSDAQYLCAEIASKAYDELNFVGLDDSKGVLKTGEVSKYGQIKVLKRQGTHYFSRNDWQFFNEWFK